MVTRFVTLRWMFGQLIPAVYTAQSTQNITRLLAIDSD
jgi:hypothetical protein